MAPATAFPNDDLMGGERVVMEDGEAEPAAVRKKGVNWNNKRREYLLRRTTMQQLCPLDRRSRFFWEEEEEEEEEESATRKTGRNGG